MKSCRTCGQSKPLDAFHKNSKGAQGRMPDCADCRNRKVAERHDSVRQKDKDLRRNYGISLDDYEAMLEAQGGVCAVCRQPERGVLRGKLKRLAVDHDHATGAVRGLLCQDCNKALGCFHDDPARIEAAIAYLEKHGRA